MFFTISTRVTSVAFAAGTEPVAVRTAHTQNAEPPDRTAHSADSSPRELGTPAHKADRAAAADTADMVAGMVAGNSFPSSMPPSSL